MDRTPIVAIGASAGGLEAYKELLGSTPFDSGAAYVLIPHLDPAHKSMMVEILGRHTEMPVIQVEDNLKVQANHVYIVPPNRNLLVKDGVLMATQIEKTNRINMPIDIFLRSLANDQQERAICIILSGTMSDGAMGLRAIKEQGGLAIAQSPETAQHTGMPQSAINTGLVDLVLPITEMPEAINKYITHSFIKGIAEPGQTDQEIITGILELILASSGYDFRCYKQNTLVRRMGRRMVLNQIEDLSKYFELLKENPEEIVALFKDILIGVTEFFREPKTWDNVKDQVLMPLVRNLKIDEPVRVWVPACSTGEEPYTIAILLSEIFSSLKRPFNAQIFATDIDESAITVARAGIYSSSIAANITPERLKHYFREEAGEYQIREDLRDKVIFAMQNIVGDAPFSNLHFISCRNLLIYLNSDIQSKVIELFHYALNKNGALLLGNSETVGYHTGLFEVVSKESRIYRSVGSRDRTKAMNFPLMQTISRAYEGSLKKSRAAVVTNNLSEVMRTGLLKKYAPPSVLLNVHGEIVQFYGDTNRYLNLPQNEPVLELISMVKEGLKLKVRSMVHQLGKTTEEMSYSARVKRNNRYLSVLLTVVPILHKGDEEKLFLLTFEGNQQPQIQQETVEDFERESTESESVMISELEDELKITRVDLQNTIEELETSNEELKASNEEMMSMNEELQSSNEELETSKEELQSLNEELHTVNAELREKVRDLESLNNDLVNLMNSTDVATVFLDIDFRIRRFTPAAKMLFKLIASDIGRPISDLSNRFSDTRLTDEIQKVLDELIPSTVDVKTDEGLWYTRTILPFKTQDNRIDGAVITFNDITELKNSVMSLRDSETALERANALLTAILENTQVMTAYLDTDFTFVMVNGAYASANGKTREWYAGTGHFELFPDEENERIFRQVRDSGVSYSVDAKPYEHPVKGHTYWNWGLYPVKDEQGAVIGLVLTLMDVTEMVTVEKRYREDLQQQNDALQETKHFLETIFNYSGFSIYVIDVLEDGTYRYAAINQVHERLINIKNSDIEGKTPYDLEKCFSKEIIKHVVELYDKCVRTRKSLVIEENIPIDGKETWWLRTLEPLVDENTGRVYRLIGNAKVITEKKKAEKEIERSLREKEILLREIHHRVKNNLAIVSSLLSLQAETIKDEHYLDIFKDSLSRVRSMALVHEKLYKGGDLSRINLPSYIKDLCQTIIDTFGVSGKSDLKLEIERFKLDIDTLIPFGLILNELMTNTIKHAITSSGRIEISLSLRLLEGGCTEFVFSDNGPGMPDDFDIDSTGGLGWKLIRNLTRQLDGSIRLNREEGATYVMEFPVKNPHSNSADK